jgi:acyl-CoA thioesterase-1
VSLYFVLNSLKIDLMFRLLTVLITSSYLTFTPVQSLGQQQSDPSSQELRVLILGDSLTEGYGLEPEQAFPQLVEQQLISHGISVRVINGGVSGATSASAPSRLNWYLRSKPDFMLLALGANDGLRGLSVESMEENLSKTIEMAKQADIHVLLTGMLTPPNMGPEYSASFAAVFPRLAERYKLPLLPFLLEGVAAVPELNQADGIHPNADGAKIVSNIVYEFLLPYIETAVQAH